MVDINREQPRPAAINGEAPTIDTVLRLLDICIGMARDLDQQVLYHFLAMARLHALEITGIDVVAAKAPPES